MAYRSSTPARIARDLLTTSVPSGVSDTPSEDRLNNRMPRWRSTRLSMVLTDGWVRSS
ncbi:hypothetical protein H4W33_002388 [Kibdelosporangium phytohabitans]|nr:hypothetical protein [Kibdelosporangium phytohabitans]MBE1463376.1 hypothetical protein [Kibdelosporangium phytohabitans]